MTELEYLVKQIDDRIALYREVLDKLTRQRTELITQAAHDEHARLSTARAALECGADLDPFS